MAELEMTESRSQALVGSATIFIRHLQFPQDGEVRALDEKNVQRLLEIFEIAGCENVDKDKHHIPAVVPRLQLEYILHQNGRHISQLQDLKPPKLLLDHDAALECLHGRHRLAAARRYLPPNESWWVVDLYVAEALSIPARESIRHEYDNARAFNDGFILRHIHGLGNDKNGRGKWLARLSSSKRRDLASLWRRDVFQGLRDALHKLVPYPGLLDAFLAGTLHRILTMRCPEELSHYLTHILATWETIVGRDCAAHVDANTVASLQGRSPHSCVEDRDYITKIFVSGELFRTVTDQTARRFILDRLLQIKTIIPSIHTFLEDTKFLEPPSKILRVLLPFDYKGTIQEGLMRAYTLPQDGSFRVQKHENEYMSLKQLPEFGFWSAYRQLWLFALRHFPFISDVKPRKSSRGHAVDIGTKTSRECWFLLADLAMKVGFWSPEIQSLHSSNTIETEDSQIQPQAAAFDPPQLTIDLYSRWRLNRRCGRLFDRPFQRDQRHFFLQPMYEAQELKPRQTLTSFTITRDIFHAFFGKLPELFAAGSATTLFISPEVPQMLGPEIFIDSPTPTNNATHAAAHATHTQTAAQATHTAVEELARYPTSSDQSTNHQNQNDTDMSETQNEMLTVDAECIEMQASNPEPHISVSTEDHAESRPPELLFLYEERETVGVAPDVALDVESALDVISRGQLGDKTEFLAYPSAEITLNPGIHRSGTRFPPRNLEDGRPSNQLETRGRSSLIGRRGTQFPRSKTAGITLSSSFSGLEEVAFGIPEQKGEVASTEDRLPQEEDVLPAAGAPLSYAAPTEIQAERPRSQVLPHKGQQMPQEAPAFPPEVGPTTQTDAVAPNVMSAAMSIEQAHHDLQGLHSDDTERVTQRLLPASSDSACGTLMSQGVKEIVGIRSGTEEVALPSDFLVVVPAEAAQAANGLQSDSASPKTKVPCLFSDRDVAGKRPIAGPSSQYRSSQGCSSSPPPLQLQLPTSAHLKLKRGKEADADLQLNPPTKRDQPEASSTLEKIGQNGVTVKYEWSSSASVQGFLKTYIEGDPPFNLPFCILFDYEITFFHDDDEGVAKWRQTLQDAFSRHLPICQPDKSVSRYSPLTQPELQDLTTQRRKIPLYIPTGKIFNNAIPISGEGTQREAKRRGREGGRKDGTTLNFLVSSDEIIQIPAYSLETKDWVLHSWRRS